MKTDKPNGIAYIECSRRPSWQLVGTAKQALRADNSSAYDKMHSAFTHSTINAAYNKIAEGLWCFQFQHAFHDSTEMKSPVDDTELFYELEYFFVDSGTVLQIDSSRQFSLHSNVVFCSSGYNRSWHIAAGSRFRSYKFVFTPAFLKENFYIADPALQNMILGQVINSQQPGYERQVFEEELNLIQQLDVSSDRQAPHLLQIISRKTIAMQLFFKFYQLEINSMVCNYADAAIFPEAICLLKAQVDVNFPGIPALAAACHVSVPTFKRKFKQHFHTTPERYYRQLQMEEAERLVKKHSMTLREIAGHLGFTSLQSFRNAFKNIRGYLPAWIKN